jgi:hypothetical protein
VMVYSEGLNEKTTKTVIQNSVGVKYL